MTHLDAPTVIRTKRDGGRLTAEAIDWVVAAYTDGEVADEQMSALLMAIFLRGMDRDEIARWTAAMVASGERFDFSDVPRPTVDKHSTGGVGDKLEAIPGFTAELSKDRIRQQLCDAGAAIFAAGELAPADRKIYALRDVTATTESLPLIASSVMSKKIAEGTRALVLDCKVGSGAFLETEAEWRELARTMVELGAAAGLVTRALLTDMNTPLGAAVGNSVEVTEALEVLAGGGPADVVELTLALAGEMLDAAGVHNRDPADTLREGTAMDCFRRIVAAQGGDLSAPLPLGVHTETVTAQQGGTMGDIDAMAVAMTAWRLGAGRSHPGQPVQPGAGVRIHRRPGEPVTAGEPLFTLHTDTPERLGPALVELDGGFRLGAHSRRPLVIDRIES